MYSYFKPKPKNYISSIDQLLDHRAKHIATQEGLHVDAIYPLCKKITVEIDEHENHLTIPLSDTDKDEVLSQYRLQLAAAAVLSYELTKRLSISFPIPSSDQVKQVPIEILFDLKNKSWRTIRLGHPNYYDMMGRIYDDNLKNLESTVASGKIDIDLVATFRKLHSTI